MSWHNDSCSDTSCRRELTSPADSIFLGGLYLAWVNPYGIHGITVGWGLSQFIVPWTSWIPCGMIMEWLIPYGIWAYPPWIPWNKSIWIPLKFHMENTMIFVVKNSVKYENWTLKSTTHHMHEWENTLTAAISDHWKTITWPQYILCTMASTNNNLLLP